jgi:hypothetical protein
MNTVWPRTVFNGVPQPELSEGEKGRRATRTLQSRADKGQFCDKYDKADKPEDDGKAVGRRDPVMIQGFQDASQVLVRMVAPAFRQGRSDAAVFSGTRLQKRKTKLVVGGGNAGEKRNRGQQYSDDASQPSNGAARPLAPFEKEERD